MRHMLSLSTIEQTDFLQLLDQAIDFARDPFPTRLPLNKRCVGIEFRKTSTRTRTSFAAAAVRLGATPIIFGPNDLQTNTGEPLEDTVRVLAGYLDALVLRTASYPDELRRMAALNCIPIVNAMTSEEHPTQALSDIAMLKRHFGTLSGLRLLYSGEGNNTAVALAYAVSRCAGMEAEFRTPESYGLSPEVLETASKLGKRFGGRIVQSHFPLEDRNAAADIVYTTRWQTTGTTKPDPQWRDHFAPFRVTEESLSSLLRQSNSVFMHDLPAVRGEECDASVLDGSASICFPQAQQKLFTAMAVLNWCTER